MELNSTILDMADYIPRAAQFVLGVSSYLLLFIYVFVYFKTAKDDANTHAHYLMRQLFFFTCFFYVSFALFFLLPISSYISRTFFGWSDPTVLIVFVFATIFDWMFAFLMLNLYRSNMVVGILFLLSFQRYTILILRKDFYPLVTGRALTLSIVATWTLGIFHVGFVGFGCKDLCKHLLEGRRLCDNDAKNTPFFAGYIKVHYFLHIALPLLASFFYVRILRFLRNDTQIGGHSFALSLAKQRAEKVIVYQNLPVLLVNIVKWVAVIAMVQLQQHPNDPDVESDVEQPSVQATIFDVVRRFCIYVACQEYFIYSFLIPLFYILGSMSRIALIKRILAMSIFTPRASSSAPNSAQAIIAVPGGQPP